MLPTRRDRHFRRLASALALMLVVQLATPQAARAAAPEPPAIRLRRALLKLGHGAKHLVLNTRAEIVAAAILGGLALGGIALQRELRLSEKIPLSYAMVKQLEYQAQRDGLPLHELARYYAYTNDAMMDVFESHNDAKDGGGEFARNFARHLDYQMNLPRDRAQLPYLLPPLSELARKAKGTLDDFSTVGDGMARVSAALASTWSEHHNDHYEDVLKERTITWTDSTGTHSKIEQYYIREYQYTDHDYRYDATQGTAAVDDFRRVRGKVPALALPTVLQPARQTDAENDYAVELSRRARNKSRPLSDAELLELAKIWSKGATYSANGPEIIALWNQALKDDASAWEIASQSADDQHYRTKQRSHPGPKEYQIAQGAQQNSALVAARVQQILEGFDYTAANAPLLEGKIKQLIAIEISGSKGQRRQLAREILSISRNIYQKNFRAGSDITPFRGWLVAVMMLCGSVLGGALGYGLDRYIDERYERSGKRRQRPAGYLRGQRQAINSNIQTIALPGVPRIAGQRTINSLAQPKQQRLTNYDSRHRTRNRRPGVDQPTPPSANSRR
ncbi:MAG: hypothetical protein H6707_07280 [Deltaproteobacteria bacterium]|nr:hypothetical protein [Deltaproteobacteria bacterium]